MFENLVKFWQGKDFLIQVLDDFEKMLTASETMFDMANKSLLAEKTEPGVGRPDLSAARTVSAH